MSAASAIGPFMLFVGTASNGTIPTGSPPQLRIGLLCDRREEPVKIQLQNLDVIGAAHIWERSIFAFCSP
jgi:hypothetical protein